MRIVFINQFFWPDAAATSQLLTDLVRVLSSQGHDVEIICGRSSYASRNDREEAPAATVHRVASAPFARGSSARLQSYLSFFAGALWKGLRIKPADIVVTMTTPPMLPVLGTLLRLLRHKKHLIWEMDLFPEALTGVGMLPQTSWIVKFLGALADYARRHSEGVIAIGDCMRRRLIERGIEPSKIYVAENWADSREIHPFEHRDGGPLRILYSGNLGLSHETETIQTVMFALKDDARFEFRFVGGGAKHEALAEQCRRLDMKNVTFLPYCRRDELDSSLAWGDIGLITQLTGCLGTVVPSKIYGVMAAARPVLYIGPKDSTPASIVRRFQCGWQVECGNASSVMEVLARLEAHRGEIRAAGWRAREAFLEHYDLGQGAGRICGILGVPVAMPRSHAAAASK